MESEIDKQFTQTYSKLIEEFKQEIINITSTNYLPKPFIPAYGKNYEKCDYKIAFVGIDTYKGENKNEDKGGLKEFLNLPDFQKLIHCNIIDPEKDCKYPEYLDYATHWKSFWNWVVKFLCEFYDIPDHRKIIKDDTYYEKYIKQLTSFIYGNVSSISEKSQYDHNINKLEWQQVKQASTHFDKAEYLLKVFNPDLMILLGLYTPTNWYSNIEFTWTDIDDHTKYTKINNTHIYQTVHPSVRSYNGLEKIPVIFKSIIEKNIFQDFPGMKMLKRQNQLLAKLKEQNEKIANESNLHYSQDPNLGSVDTAFTFEREEDKWNKFKIYFYFGDTNYTDFSFGIGVQAVDARSDSDGKLKNLAEKIYSLLKSKYSDIGKQGNWEEDGWGWKKYNSDYINWNNGAVWTEIENGTFMNNFIKDEVKKLSEVIDEVMKISK